MKLLNDIKMELKRLDRNGIYKYWKNPDYANRPEDYLLGIERSRFLFDRVRQHVPLSVDSHIIELGCNVGRNLNVFYENGYKNLYGVDINGHALNLLREHYMGLSGVVKLYQGKIEDHVYKFTRDDKAFDLTFTMAVLEHIHARSHYVFSPIAHMSRYVVTVEDEKTRFWRAWPRDYQNVFEVHGMKQVYNENCADIPGLNKSFMLRVFKNTAFT